jgi:hypothetical protein
VSVLSFLVVFGQAVVNRCELSIAYKVVCFVFVFFLR